MNASTIRSLKNRVDAGRRLAPMLLEYADRKDTLILALPRGGVPVAAEIASALHLPFDVLVVRKIGVPDHPELAMGAIASGGVRVMNEAMVSTLGLSEAEVDAVVRRETEELARRESLYREGRPPPAVEGNTVIVVDDGIATGSTMSAAIALLRRLGAARIVVAVPVAPRDTVHRLRAEAEEVVTVLEPEPFIAVSRWYEDFAQTADDEVRALLAGDCAAPRLREEHLPAFLSSRSVLETIRRHARPVTADPADLDGLLELIGDAGVVLLGEASHGTHEFYRLRAEITKRLITEQGFTAVAAEADWPDAYLVNRFVRGEQAGLDAVDALAGFERFPSWMWRNADVLDFIGWLKDHNERVYAPECQVGFYGLDLYSLHKSMNEVIAYLEKRDPAEAAKARILYGCIDRYGRDPQNYGLLAGAGVSDNCRAEVIQQLGDLRAKEVEYLSRNGRAVADEYFFAEQNALLVRNAEQYYRKMFRSYVSSWNLRDEHMMEMLVKLVAHLQTMNGNAKVVVWAHNSHIGDARATEMAWRGELNIGQLAREAFGGQCRLIGFTTYTGTVTAASGWHAPAERKQVIPGMEGSYEKLFHQAGLPAFWLDLTAGSPAAEALLKPRLERAIGVVYQPETERRSHYFESSLARQFDAVIHCDLTRAVEPLERGPQWALDEAPETFPAGL